MLITCGFSKQDEMLIDADMIVQSIKIHTMKIDVKIWTCKLMERKKKH